MKKALTLTLVVAAMVSQAVTITWDSNKTKISFNGATTVATAGGITATLLWLGTDSSATISGYTIANGIVADTTTTKSSGLASTKGTYSKDYSKGIGTTYNNDSDLKLAAGDYFTVLLTYTQTVGEETVTWYNLSSSVYQLPVDADDQTNDLAGHFAHSFAMNDRGTALTAGGGWTAAAATPIPEPSTAALALAGLALLIKRRKA